MTDREVKRVYWVIQYLADKTYKRIIGPHTTWTLDRSEATRIAPGVSVIVRPAEERLRRVTVYAKAKAMRQEQRWVAHDDVNYLWSDGWARSHVYIFNNETVALRALVERLTKVGTGERTFRVVPYDPMVHK